MTIPPNGADAPARRNRPDDWLVPVAAAAAAASQAPGELLGQYLLMLADAAIDGRRSVPADLAAVRELGRQAAEQGVDAGHAVDLYLSAAWRLWRELPVAARSRDRGETRAAAEAMLRVLDDAVGAMVAGHQDARRDMIRYEEALRRDFVDDLLRGDADVARMVERAEPFGLDLSAPHSVALVTSKSTSAPTDRAAIVLERAVVDRFGDRDVLVATKDGRVVVLVPGTATTNSHTGVADVILTELARTGLGDQWQVATGRAFPGAYGVARSYEEARESTTWARRLNLTTPVVTARDLLVYRVLGRDQAALVDLVREVLGPLTAARGGPAPLLATLEAYFGTGQVATDTAKQLNLSVRAVTYRLTKVHHLTGYSTSHADQRYTLHTAVLGARLLDWPHHPLPTP